MHLAHALGVIPGRSQFTGQVMRIIEPDAIAVAHPAVMLVGHAREQAGARRDTARHRGVSLREPGAAMGELVQVGCFHHRVAGHTEAVAPELVGHDQEDIGAGWH